MITRGEIFNLASQFLVRSSYIVFGVIMIGAATRRLSDGDTHLLLVIASCLSIPGLVQLGLGSLILQRVTNAWARDHRLDDLPEVRGAFALIVWVSSIALIAVAAATVSGALPLAVLPLGLVALASQWAIVADYVRLAKGQSFKTNLFQYSSLAVGALLMTTALWRPHPAPALVIFAAFAAPFLAPLASFALLLRDPDFAGVVSLRGRRVFWAPIRSAMPMYLGNVALAVMLAVPIAGDLLPRFPALSLASLACLRLSTNALYTYYFVLQPLAPALMRFRHQAGSSGAVWRILTLLGGAIAIGVLGSVIFAVAAPTFIRLWLGHIDVSAAMARQWGLILGLWTTLMTATFFCQLTSRPLLAALSLTVVDLAVAGLAMWRPLESVENALIGALILGVCLSLWAAGLAVRDIFREQHGLRLAAAGSSPAN